MDEGLGEGEEQTLHLRSEIAIEGVFVTLEYSCQTSTMVKAVKDRIYPSAGQKESVPEVSGCTG